MEHCADQMFSKMGFKLDQADAFDMEASRRNAAFQELEKAPLSMLWP